MTVYVEYRVSGTIKIIIRMGKRGLNAIGKTWEDYIEKGK